MNKKEMLAEMSVKELQDVIYTKQDKEQIDKYGTKKNVEFNIKEVDSLEARSSGSLFHVRVEDGCEGWEALVEIPMVLLDDWRGDTEEFVEDHIINFMIENDYYPEGNGSGVEEIIVEEICRYSRPFFKIY